ncbi:MAG: recombination mediator RecR [Verrucomicrobiota bacterium]
MTPSFEHLQSLLKKLPGLGFRSAERLALHLLVERPDSLDPLLHALQTARDTIGRCVVCGHVAEGERCEICADDRRSEETLCLVERVPDLTAIDRSGAFKGRYHVLHGRLSPIHDVGPEQLNLASLLLRLERGQVREIILALSNDIEGEATCHYLQTELFAGRGLAVTRIGFGLPSGGGLTFADATTVRSALDGRKPLT